MRDAREFVFEPFHLDMGAERLWRGEEMLRLTAKAFAVLRYLVGHAGQLVTKAEIIKGVWALPYVSDAALTVCISEIRRVLGDTAQTPRFLETVRGRGYRFVAPVTVVAPFQGPSVARAPQPVAVRQPGIMVGREKESTQLQQWWVQAQQRVRQVVFVTGEAGIGKTTLVDAFATQVAATEAAWYGRGQCIEQYGAGEAYLPLLDALGQLGRSPHGTRLVEVLRQQAPSWLLQMPTLTSAADFDSLRHRSGGATRERMLRELAEAIEVLTTEWPLLLVLEDLHWSDVSTLDWLAYVARRRQPARLLVLGTYRPTDAMMHQHPVHSVTQDLLLHRQGIELRPGYLSATDVGAYLTRRCGTVPQQEALARALYQRTDGNPLFLATVVEELMRQGVLQEGPTGWELIGGIAAVRSIPSSLRQLIERQFEELAPEAQTLLEAASVVGVEFSAAAIAASVTATVEDVETWCNALVRQQQFVQVCGATAWADGTVATRYGFIHTLCQEVVYSRVPAGRRVQWHQRIGIRLEAGYGPQVQDMAAELAEHFVRGRDTRRAVQYLRAAGDNALRRRAHQEAITHLTAALDLLKTLPDAPERARSELDIQLMLGAVLVITQGQAAAAVVEVYTRARALCEQIGDAVRLFQTLVGLRACSIAQADLRTGHEVDTQLLTLAQHTREPLLLLEAHRRAGDTCFFRGAFVEAQTHLEQGSSKVASHHPVGALFPLQQDPGVRSLAVGALVRWMLGWPTQAMQSSQAALMKAQAQAHPHDLSFALLFTALLHQCRRESLLVQERAEALITLSTEYAWQQRLARGLMLRGWAVAMQGHHEAGIAQIRQGMAAYQGTEPAIMWPYVLTFLAEAYAHADQADEGLRVLAEALHQGGKLEAHFYQAEICRLQGELMLQARGQRSASDTITLAQTPHSVESQAEVCFHQALTIARHQQAKSLELRAAISLSRLWQRQSKQTEALHLLQGIYEWFSEGFDTADVQAAQGLLAALR
jgi:DNA-binding winged helix-turn-helix (wHTH) protein/predicted ATPase